MARAAKTAGMTRAEFLAELTRRRVDVFAVDDQDLARDSPTVTSDTTPDAHARFDALMRSRSGSDRVVSTCEMFDPARALMAARIKKLEPNIASVELEIRMSQRIER